MKTKDIAKNYQLDLATFQYWLQQTGVPTKSSMTGGLTIDDNQDVGALVQSFQAWNIQAQAQAARDQEMQQRAAQEKQSALASMLITSGFTFDGYTITKYSGYISGDDAIQISRGKEGVFSSATNVGDSLMASLAQIRRNALAELREAAYALGCNAVIGVDFDYLTLDPQTRSSTQAGGVAYLPYVFGVTANGNAVIIEKS